MIESPEREALAQWLKTLDWNYFVTVTFRREQHPRYPISSILAVQKTLSAFRPALLFLGAEASPSRYWHVHGLLAESRLITSTSDIWRSLFERHGQSKVERIKSKERVAGYCSKYISKNLGDWGMW